MYMAKGQIRMGQQKFKEAAKLFNKAIAV